MKILLTALIATSIYCNASAAENDSLKIILNSKMKILGFVDVYQNEKYFENYIKYTPPVFFLKSSGFKDRYLFYEIIINDTVVKSLNMTNFFPLSHGKVVFAFDRINEKIYIIDGLPSIDILYFYNDVKNFFSMAENISINKINFTKLFNIEGVNLKCLLKSARSKKRDNCHMFVGNINTITI